MALKPSHEPPRSIQDPTPPGGAADTVDSATQALCDHAEQLAAILAPRHERMLSAASLADEAMVHEWREETRDLDESLTAEIAGLEDCLRRVERARRESIVHSAQCASSVDGEVVDEFNVWERDADELPKRIGRFEIERELGHGGLGVVLSAHDPVLKRRVALKIPRAEALLTAELRQRFQREGQAAARLTHPNIVPVYEVGSVGPICYIAAAYIDGQSLSEWLHTAPKRIEPREAAELVAELAEAMHYAHGQGVLHRDLKPGNILLEARATSDGMPDGMPGGSSQSPRWVAKITDFGLAKLMDLTGDETRTGVILGTPAYMSPEQAGGGKSKLGPESDVYSLGAILYELLTGQPPFRGETDTETLLQVTHRLPEAPRRADASIPTDLEAICLHCLEKHPEQRYRTAGAVAADLRRFLAGEPTVARPLSAAKRLLRWARRRPEQAALTVLGLAALMTIAAGMAVHTHQLNNAVDLANRHAALAERNRQLSVQHENRANEQLYTAHMRLTDRALREGDLPTAQSLIERYGSGQASSRLRGIEWHILRAEVERALNANDSNSTTIFDHPADVDTVQFTPDGRWMLSGCQDGHLRIWETAQWRLLWDIPAHGSCINKVRISPDGRRVVTASCDATIAIWRIESSGPPVPVHRLPHPTAVRRATFSPDGLLVAALCDGKEIAPHRTLGALHVWNAESGQLAHHDEFEAPLGAHGLEWSPDGRWLATLREDSVTAFRTSDWSRQYSTHMRVHQIAFQPVSGQLTMLAQEAIRQVDLDTQVEGTLLETLHSGLLSWSADGRFVAISRGDGMVSLFDGRNAFRPHCFYQGHDDRVVELAFTPDSARLATAGFDGRVCVTDLSKRLGHTPVVRQALPDKAETGLAYDAKRRHVTWLQNGEFRRAVLNSRSVGDAKSQQAKDSLTPGEKLLEIPLPHDALLDRKISAEGKRAAWIMGRQVTVADLEVKTTYSLPAELTASIARVLVFDQRSIAFLSNDFTVGVFDLEKRQLIFTEKFDASPGADMTAELSPDGRTLLVINPLKSIRLIDLSTARSRLVHAPWHSWAPAFSPDNRHFSVIVGGTLVGIWETESLKQTHCLHPRRRALLTAFSSDSRTLAIASEQDLTFWNTASGEEVVSLALPSKPVRMQFSPDGKGFYLIAENEGDVEVYEWLAGDNW